MAEQDRRHVLAADRLVDPVGPGAEPVGVAKEEPGNVEDMDAEVLNDEALAGEDIEGGA